MRRRSRPLSRKRKGSRNHRQASLRLAKLHRRIKNIRRDFLHKTTIALAKAKLTFVVEDLSGKALARGRLSRSVTDVGWGMFRRMLEYKCRWYGARLILAPRDFPSTPLGSRCGHRNGRLPFSQRVFRCAACGLEMDRDLHAAIHLRNYGLAVLNSSTASSAGRDACRGPQPVEDRLGCPRSLWRRNGGEPVDAPRVEEAGSDRSWISPRGVK